VLTGKVFLEAISEHDSHFVGDIHNGGIVSSLNSVVELDDHGDFAADDNGHSESDLNLVFNCVGSSGEGYGVI